MASTAAAKAPSAAGAAGAAAAADAAKVKICTGHTRPICHINYSAVIDGTYWFVTSCHDAKPMLRNGETCDWVGTFEGHKGAVYSSSFNAGATLLVTGSGDFSAMVWDAVTGQRLHKWEHPHYIKSTDWVGDRIATGNYDGKVRIFDATNYATEPTVLTACDKPMVKNVYFTPDGCLVTACDAVVTKWDLRSLKSVATRELPGLNVLEYTHQHALVAAHAKSITLLDPLTLRDQVSFATGDDVECASLSPCGRFLAAGSKIKVKEFSVADGGAELQSHRGHHGPIFHVRWAPDGKTFASGAEDGMVRVWPCNEVIAQFQE